MYVRKRSFFEIFLPLTVITFLGQGTSFIDVTHISVLRFLFVFVLFLYFFLNRKIFAYVSNTLWLFILCIYLFFCVMTSLWSDVFSLTFMKSTIFLITVITLITAGSVWVVRFGQNKSLDWLMPILIITIISGLLGGKADDQINDIILYGGLSGNPNNFGFLTAMIVPLLLWGCFCAKKNKKILFFLLIFLALDLKFLFSSYSRSSIVNLLCVVMFFSLSLSLSKKIFITMISFFSLTIMLVMTPVSFLEGMLMKHMMKGHGNQINEVLSNKIFFSRQKIWKQSLDDAQKGGLIGVGFTASVGDKKYRVGKGSYERGEKGNSQLSIMEETGVIGLLLFFFLITSFYFYVLPYFIRMQGDKRVMMGLVLGSISGLLAESLVEAWWDSLGPEVICFWMLVGVTFGNIYLMRKGREETYCNYQKQIEQG